VPEPLRRLLAGALLLSPLVALGSASPASAADVTCDGLTATMVGTPGGRIFGTPFDDVIVSNGAEYVDGADGNDVICTTGSVPKKNHVISISGGRGNNVIDRRGDLDPAVGTQVPRYGDTETFFGGPGADQVSLARTTPFAGPVSVQTGDGDDSVFVDHITQFAVPASVDTGVGDDMVSVTDTVTNLQLVGGDGDDTLVAGDASGPGTLRADAAAGVLTFASGRQLPFTGFDTYAFGLANPKTQVKFRGSSRREAVEVSGRGQLSSASMGGGDDVVRYTSFTMPMKASLKGGPGRDRLELLEDRESDVHVDLAAHWFSAHGHHCNGLRQFEDASGMGAVVTLKGDRKDNDLQWWGCSGGAVDGGAGNDRISPLPPIRVCSQVAMHATGGPGSDRLTGSPGRDVLDGGPGRDKADGGPGVDSCRDDELLKSCEQRS
jgi:RTX calcium-binding nonapeptide repeat (4 copies)